MKRTYINVALVALACGACLAVTFLGEQSNPVAAAATAVPIPEAANAEMASETESNFEKGQAAYAELRLLRPPGENAFEYFLNDFEKNEQARNAALELVPTVTDAMLADLNSERFDEAERLLNLLDKADPNSSFLARIRLRLQAQRQQIQTPPNDSFQPTQSVVTKSAQEVDAIAESIAKAELSMTQPTALSAQAPPQQSGARSLSAESSLAPLARNDDLIAKQSTRTDEQRQQQVETPARLISPIRATYPGRARQQGLTGWVDLRITVDARGGVRKAEVVRGNPARVFDREAVRAAKRLKYEPKRVGDLAVETSVNQRIVFNGG